MITPTESESENSSPVFDPFSDEYFNDPYALYARLRNEAPVHYNSKYGFWALARNQDVAVAHRDWEQFSSSHGVDLFTLTLDPSMVQKIGSMIMMDPPEHDRLRGLVSRVFTPKAVQDLEPMAREVISGVADSLEGVTSFDAIEDFAALFPSEIISRMLGVPQGDRQKMRHWMDLALSREAGSSEPTKEGMEAGIAATAYFFELAQSKRRSPGDDMISRLTGVTVARESGGESGLTDEEIAGFSGLLAGAGAETVTKLLGNVFVLMARHPDQWAAVVKDHAIIPGAIEETLRYWPPSQYQGRYSMSDSQWHGVTIPAGHPVILLTGAATRDERAYERPDEYDIFRKPAYALAFGLGIHTCLGAALARLESRIAIEEMAQRWPKFDVDESQCERVQMVNVAGYSKVPITVT